MTDQTHTRNIKHHVLARPADLHHQLIHSYFFTDIYMYKQVRWYDSINETVWVHSYSKISTYTRKMGL